MHARERQRDKFLRIAFDITAVDWDTVFEYEKGRCPICGKSIRTKPRPHTDHDHVSGNFRGILCGQCNRALGKAQDKRWGWTPVCFLKAFLYLIQHPAKLALGRQPVGYPGRIGTKAYRKWVKKKADSIETASRHDV
jgi:recombination endonuclease VII